jgi:hypothetical protein
MKHDVKIHVLHNLCDNSHIIEYVNALESYGDQAALEAITRALVAERSGSRERASLWMSVFAEIAKKDTDKS